MRVSVAMIVLAAVASAMPSGAAAQPARTQRQVELIPMQTKPAEVTAAPDVASSLSTAMPPSRPAAFRVHDLSRRYVEYRMAQELPGAAPPEAAKASGPTGSALSPAIAATSSIVVPGWMRGAHSAAPAISYAPGCSPLAYRPAGFLGRDAEARRATYYGMMSAVACEQGIPTGLFDAMIIRESGYNPLAISPKKAFGFAQLMPATAASLGVDRYNPMQNMRGGARYLRRQLDRFGQVQLALAAYNAGPGRVRNGLVPRIAESQAYVTNIVENWSRLSGLTTHHPFQQPVRMVRQVELAAF